uniref:AlNc14C18G1900 protein n=1 Tax=Albugo laibachii Nc14 TaxID=890382 RepID=F0W4T2_9STRA|nr:AlNc14C18G1900 [Albugo laibachii Nc14]|eukprot:CCA16118.1 AlNc14C18G1900 [Albugo laibachii Nc14]
MQRLPSLRHHVTIYLRWFMDHTGPQCRCVHANRHTQHLQGTHRDSMFPIGTPLDGEIYSTAIFRPQLLQSSTVTISPEISVSNSAVYNIHSHIATSNDRLREV